MRIFLTLLLVLTGCVAPSPPGRDPAATAESLEQALPELERLRDRNPNDPRLRIDLTTVYYRLARKALDEDRQDEYIDYLTKASNEVIEATRLDPTSPASHTWMGIIAAYRDDLEASSSSFRNAQRLDPRRSPVHDLNIAQICIYQGDLSKARRWLGRAHKKHAQGAYVDLIESLAAWRAGDLVEARDLFDSAYTLDPKAVNTWDEAPVDQPIESFRDFQAYCCSNHTCGPHMGDACKRERLAVKHRNVHEETVRKELVIEMERRRKLEEIYEKRKDLNIEVGP